MAASGPARAICEKAGFVPCQPFDKYQPSPNRTYTTLLLTGQG